MEFICKNEKQTKKFAKKFAKKLNGGEIILLFVFNKPREGPQFIF